MGTFRRSGISFIRELEFLPGVDDIGFQIVEFDDLGVTAAVAEVFPGDLPQRIAVYDGVDAGRGIDRFAGRIKNAVAGVGVGAGLRVCEDFEGAFLRFGIRPRFPYTVERFGGAAGLVATGGCAALELRRDLFCEVTHAVHHPRTGTGGGREPAVDGQDHLVGFRGVIQRFRFVAKPQELGFAVAALDQLTENAAIYAGIILNKTDGLTDQQRAAYQDLQRVQGAPSYLLLMYLIKNQELLQIDSDEIVKACKLLVNFFVRRNLTDTPPTRDLARMFMSFIEEIEQQGYMGDAIYTNLRNRLLASSASDEVFEEKLRGPVYDDNVGATRFILCMMAKRGMTVETERDLWRKTGSNQYVWSIEHIFPQGSNIPDEWVDMIAGGDRAKAKEYQSLYVHTFGNLTITGYNSSLSNKAFAEKKERKDNNGHYIGYLNGLNLNDDVCDKDEWTVEVIQARTDRMVKEIMVMFAL